MHSTATLCRALALSATLCLLSLASGCEQTCDQLASAIKPASAQDVALALNDKIAHRKYKEAKAEGDDFLRGKADRSGQVDWALAQACAQLGNADLAILHAGQALKAGAVAGIDLMAEPLLEPVRTDPRLVALAAGVDASKGVAPVTPAQRPASASVDGGAVHASAGGVSVTLPD